VLQADDPGRKCGVEGDDILVSVDGADPRGMLPADVLDALHDASFLEFSSRPTQAQAQDEDHSAAGSPCSEDELERGASPEAPDPALGYGGSRSGSRVVVLSRNDSVVLSSEEDIAPQ